MKLPHDPNVWIADSAATVHTMPNASGGIPINGNTSDTTTTLGNGTIKIVQKAVNLPGIICNNHGNELERATPGNVAIYTNAKFNLFSLTRMLQGG